MQNKLKKPNKKFHCSICQNSDLLYVRSEFQQGFAQCSYKQQYQYYIKAVAYLTENQQEKKNNNKDIQEDIIYQAKIEDLFKWSDLMKMTISPSTYRITLQQKQKSKGEKTTINLRNYIFRKSKKHPHNNIFVLEAIKSMDEKKIKIYIVSEQKKQEQQKIYQLIKDLSFKALRQDIIHEKKQIEHITVKKQINNAYSGIVEPVNFDTQFNNSGSNISRIFNSSADKNHEGEEQMKNQSQVRLAQIINMDNFDQSDKIKQIDTKQIKKKQSIRKK